MLHTYTSQFKIALKASLMLFTICADATFASDGSSRSESRMSDITNELTAIESQLLAGDSAALAAADQLNALRRSGGIGALCNQYDRVKEVAQAQQEQIQRQEPPKKEQPKQGLSRLPEPVLSVNDLNNKTHRIKIHLGDTVANLKDYIASHNNVSADTIDLKVGNDTLPDNFELFRIAVTVGTINVVPKGSETATKNPSFFGNKPLPPLKHEETAGETLPSVKDPLAQDPYKRLPKNKMESDSFRAKDLPKIDPKVREQAEQAKQQFLQRMATMQPGQKTD